jgi:serine/threonine protein kinase
MSQNPGPDIVPGFEIAGYRIEHELGRGAMAVVYRAIQLNLERPVALKVLSPELAENSEFVGRFFNEARAAAALSHANIIQAYDAGLAEGNIHYFAMEFVEGETVQTRITREGPIPVRTTLRMAIDIADALNYGWQRQKLTHGDIKPDNIMVNTDGETKLADFGLAKVEGHDFAGSDVMLTPLYASPEAIRGELVKGDCRGDIYSFGATLYHMMAGRPPFPGHETEVVLEKHLNDELTPLSSLVEGLPQGVSDFIGQMLEKDASKRPQCWKDVLKELHVLAKGGHGPPPKKLKVHRESMRQVAAHPPRPKTGPSVLVPLLVVGALLAIGGAVYVTFLRPSANGMEKPPENQQDQPGLVEAAAQTDPAAGADDAPGEAATGEPTEQEKAQEQVQQLWRDLQDKLKTFDGDPAKCVSALETFEAEHREAYLPPEFADRLKEYREAANAAPDEAEEPDEPALEPTENTKPPPELATTAPEAPRPRDLPQSQENQRKDAYTLLCGNLRSLRYRPGMSLEPLAQQTTAWLKAFPEDSDEKLIVELIAEDVLTGLNECVPRLLANKAALIGKPIPRLKGNELGIPGLKGKELSVQDLSATQLELLEATKHGPLRHPVPWEDIRDPLPLLGLCFHAFGGKDATLREREPFLAMALISRDDGWWRAAIANLPVSPRLRYWERLREDFMKVPEEYAALGSWVAARRAFLAGSEDTRAYQLARDLRGSHTDVAQRHRPEIEYIEEVAGQSVPEVQAGKLVREAQEKLPAAPFAALQMLNTVQARFGRVSFPEGRQLNDIRFKALEAIERPQRLQRMIDKTPQLAFCAQLTGNWGTPPHTAIIAYQDVSQRGDLTDPQKAMLPYAQLIALVELGDWDAARKRLPHCPPTGVPAGMPEFAACAAFASGLAGERFPESALPVDAMATIRQITTNGGMRAPSRVQLATLLCDYALSTHRCDEPEESLVLARLVEPVARPAMKGPFALASLAVHLEAGRAQQAESVLRELGTVEAARAAHRLTPANGELLLSLANFVANGAPIPAKQLELPYPNYEHFLRLTVSALCTRPEAASEAVEALVKDLPPHASGLGPVGGSALYDLTLLRAAIALQAGDLDRARAATDWGLAQTCTATFRYYPRLLFVKAGLARVAGDATDQETARLQVEGASVANESERALAQLLDPKAPRKQLMRALPKMPGRNIRFWYEWLEGTLRLTSLPKEQRARLAADIHNQQCPLAERLLTPSLAKYYQQ